jgi:single-stranded DNA-specific DHH superfamily exonuclease
VGRAVGAVAGRGRAIRAGHVGFILGPRLNAVGRIGAATRAAANALLLKVNQIGTLTEAAEAMN